MIEEKHYTHDELAYWWSMSYRKIYRMFRKREGVIVDGNTVRIPQSVAQAVYDAAKRKADSDAKNLKPLPQLSKPFVKKSRGKKSN